jgi:hypothetical protein
MVHHRKNVTGSPEFPELPGAPRSPFSPGGPCTDDKPIGADRPEQDRKMLINLLLSKHLFIPGSPFRPGGPCGPGIPIWKNIIEEKNIRTNYTHQLDLEYPFHLGHLEV